ncbi:MAG: hypothetical protein CL814_14305 [Confluentimicrobium sp.]|jgi:hypothetical protein|uniref:hypothetical protein n=1 Tax=Actibacterium sp. TaxID=1872125 RepID=UPI000C41F37A|nr:hypothetical protein [Actibacterium sp.]MBC58089.1 hypothetical protein [Actibacterium sp.]|tara:strand:+ start:3781 stop:4074 length:294 start_codon:yes stop_codon:yes gene_type:complete
MIRAACISLVIATGPVWAGAADPLAQRRAQCVGWMMTAYPSGLEEVACTNEFGLPSPFLFKCASAQRNGFADTTQQRACQVFFARASQAAGDGYVQN